MIYIENEIVNNFKEEIKSKYLKTNQELKLQDFSLRSTKI